MWKDQSSLLSVLHFTWRCVCLMWLVFLITNLYLSGRQGLLLRIDTKKTRVVMRLDYINQNIDTILVSRMNIEIGRLQYSNSSLWPLITLHLNSETWNDNLCDWQLLTGRDNNDLIKWLKHPHMAKISVELEVPTIGATYLTPTHY